MYIAYIELRMACGAVCADSSGCSALFNVYFSIVIPNKLATLYVLFFFFFLCLDIYINLVIL